MRTIITSRRALVLGIFFAASLAACESDTPANEGEGSGATSAAEGGSAAAPAGNESEPAGSEGATATPPPAAAGTPAGAPSAPPTTPGATVPAGSGSYAGLAAVVNDASAAIVLAATGGTPDARWVPADGNPEGIQATPPTVAAEIAALGSAPAPVMTVLEIEAIGTDSAGGGHYLRTSAAVFPDGRVRFVRAEHRSGETFVAATENLATLSPPLAAAVDQVVADLRNDCALPLLTAEEVANLPEDARQDLMRGLAEVPAACAAVAGVEVTWQPRYDDITVATQAGDTWAMLRSGFTVEGGNLALLPVRVRVMQ